MAAFLKIDSCRMCQKSYPWEWVPAVLLNGRVMAGTGLWRSQLTDGHCPNCQANLEARRQNEARLAQLRRALIELLGGEKPYREFTFENYIVESGNRLAFERARDFNPAAENLYLWGPCGVGKTHLVWAAARRCFEETLSVVIVFAGQLTRKVRMKEPVKEQEAINEFANAEVLVIDDVGTGPDTPFSRQVLQEILDQRAFGNRGGLLLTSKYSLDQLAAKLGDDSIPSRLGGMCHVMAVNSVDRRLQRQLNESK